MHENNILRALNNLLSQDTIVTFFVVIIFLWLTSSLFKKIRKQITNQWLAAFTASLISSATILLIDGIILICLELVTKSWYGTATTEFPKSFLLKFISLSTLISSIYLIYYGVREKWINKIENPLKRYVYETLTLFIIACIFMIIIELIGNIGSKGYRLDGSLMLATFSSVIVGTILAVFVYRYGSYLNTLKMQQKELQIARLKQQVTQSQLDALSSKINPHFLYNSLNAIAGLAIEDGLKTREMAIALSKLFRYNINRADRSVATIKEEIEMASLYLEIEKIRFEERLQYVISIEPGIENELIPMHLLQPLVENAVKHGAGPDGINIKVNIKKQGNEILLSVQDKGKIFDVNFNPGYGLKSLYDKLDILAPGKYEIAFLNDPKEVSIRFKDLKTQAI